MGIGDGPLSGMRVIEFASIGPAPLAGMILADLGADVIRVDRPDSEMTTEKARKDVVNRGKRSIVLDLKTEGGRHLANRLIATSDVLVEGFRPGVMERLGLGPHQCLSVNPRLLYGRMTGWGQSGPLSQVAGHDINYIAITGALWAIGRSDERPTPPLNLLGDYAGGTMFLLVGLLAGLLERERSGQGQVIDAAMIDGTTILMSLFSAMRATGEWKDIRAANIIDTGAPFYDVYECADGRFIAVGAIEPAFYEQLVTLSGFRVDLDAARRMEQPLREDWASDKVDWTALFLTRTRDEWAAILSNSDACVQPVLDWNEAPRHPHMRARNTFTEIDGIIQPSPAPRFSRTPARIRGLPPFPGEQNEEIAREIASGDVVP
jgi:alpha-methylacyl-CoA racemase